MARIYIGESDHKSLVRNESGKLVNALFLRQPLTLCSTMRQRQILLLAMLLLLTQCKVAEKPPVFEADDAHRWTMTLIETVMDDLFPPMIASRVYTYPLIAAHETLAAGDRSLAAFGPALRDFGASPTPPIDGPLDYSLAAFIAWSDVATKLVFSEFKIQEFTEIELLRCESMEASVRERSIAFGHAMSGHVIQWMLKDNYTETRTMSRFTIDPADSTWKQTPPDYPNSLEPNWTLIRPMILDSAGQIRVADPAPYSIDPKSEFYTEALEVYQTGPGNSEKRDSIAWYWDDNPNHYINTGHNTTFTHKISPAGHWLCIAGTSCKKASKNFAQTIEIYALTAIAQFDGFIACWEEKYRMNLVRPVTYIQSVIDPEWLPLIQTPPFPEHPSGHSVISAASATVLSHFFGEEFVVTDSTEMRFGFPERTFVSFHEAATEAGMSRLYGGIHFRRALTEGQKQGNAIGEFVLNRALPTEVNP